MDYSRFIQKFALPPDFKAPEKLAFEDLAARPLTMDDLERDLAAVNASVDIIRKTRGGTWPDGPLDNKFDFLDLAWHQREFRESSSFAYAVFDATEKYTGCFYLYPMGVRTHLNEERLLYDADASWWVTTDAYNQGYYQKLYKALFTWTTTDFPFKSVFYSNTEIPML